MISPAKADHFGKNWSIVVRHRLTNNTGAVRFVLAHEIVEAYYVTSFKIPTFMNQDNPGHDFAVGWTNMYIDWR